MTSNLAGLEPAPVWKLFETICSIPHPSGHEAALANALKGIAENHGLAVRSDAVGNLRIDRKPATGLENAPVVLLQAHLDMVPQKLTSSKFDFEKDPILPIIKDGWVQSASGTTLGGDDGAGVATAMALLLDPELKCGPLSAIFTVSEEVGLDGARGLSADFLKGDFLLNLDSEEEGLLYIGCAGGARLAIESEIPFVPTPDDRVGVNCSVENLAGGHSGTDIQLKRGNAVILLARLLEALPELEVASISGGGLSNAIPRDAFATGAIPTEIFETLPQRAEIIKQKFTQEFDAPPAFSIKVTKAPLPRKVWDKSFQATTIQLLATCPNGPATLDKTWNVVRTSSNLASVQTEAGKLKIISSQRSLNDVERKNMTTTIIEHFSPVGGEAQESDAYPGWDPNPNSILLQVATSLYHNLFNQDPKIQIIHAGLECGIISGIAPKLQLISFGPTLLHPHSPSEKLEIASVERFYRYLRELVVKLSKLKLTDK